MAKSINKPASIATALPAMTPFHLIRLNMALPPSAPRLLHERPHPTLHRLQSANKKKVC